MKRNRILTIFMLVFVIQCCFFGLVSCKKGNSGGGTPEPTKLSTPVVVLNGDTAFWDTDDKAEKFEVSINGFLSFIEKSVTRMKLEDGQTFKIRAVGDGTNYKTSDWSNMVEYHKPISTYTVTWKNCDDVLEIDNDVVENTMPSYNGATPIKASDAQYHYVFAGWSPAVGVVTSDVTYSAIFTPILNTYTVTWKNGSEVLEVDENVAYGTIPTYDGATPTKEANAQYEYSFIGWSPKVSEVTNTVTYNAQFSEVAITYTVTFYADNGTTVLDEIKVKYKEEAKYSKETPVKTNTSGDTFVFDGWVTELNGNTPADLTSVVSDMKVYASFKKFTRVVTVYIVSNNVDYGTVSLSSIDNVPFGSKIRIENNYVFVDGYIIEAKPVESNKQYTYSFVEWTCDDTVGNDTIITASFSRKLNSYTVTWKNDDTVLEVDKNVLYGTNPVYNGETPEKESDVNNVYTFSGWSPSIAAVTGDVTYYAQFTTSANKHTVIFLDEDGQTELGRVVVSNGETAIYPNDLPVKESTNQLSYTFDKWVSAKGGNIEADLTNVTKDFTVYAKYVSSVRTYTVTLIDYDGTLFKEIIVEYNTSIVLEDNPEREGYRFIGWDGFLDNITSDVTLKAEYVKQYYVEFVDYNDTIISSQLVDIYESAKEPNAPSRNNYRFTGWDTEFTNVISDLTVKAQYVRQYLVTFIGFDGSVLKEEKVDASKNATAPSVPSIDNYNFVGWDVEFNNVNSDLTVKAVYKINTFTVKFLMPDGTQIGDPQTVKYGDNAVEPICKDVFYDGDVLLYDDLPLFSKIYFSEDKKVSYFSGWDKSFENVTEDLEVYALYETQYEQPVIFVVQENTKLEVYLYCPNNCYIYSLEFYFEWTSNGTIDSCVQHISNNSDSFFNNDDKIFKYAMFDGKGITSITNFFNVTDIVFSNLHGFKLNINDIKISDTCTIVYSDESQSDIENLVKIKPIVILK